MEIIYISAIIIQSMAISLGVGGSTIAVLQFFTAIKDGKIEDSERKIMGVTYLVLRIAMVLILLSTAVVAGVMYKFIGSAFINPFIIGTWTIILVLFLNAIGMTKRWIPSTFGPGIQAGSWYSLGFLISLVSLGLTSFTYVQFFLVYAGLLVLAIAIVNIVMNMQRR